jgi:DNA-binding Xre family transcriptional regulator
MEVKCRLQEFMDEQDLTQQEVAARTGLSPTIIGRLYHNRFSRLDNQTVIKVCQLFEVQLGEMFYIDKNSAVKETA